MEPGLRYTDLASNPGLRLPLPSLHGGLTLAIDGLPDDPSRLHLSMCRHKDHVNMKIFFVLLDVVHKVATWTVSTDFVIFLNLSPSSVPADFS